MVSLPPGHLDHFWLLLFSGIMVDEKMGPLSLLRNSSNKSDHPSDSRFMEPEFFNPAPISGDIWGSIFP